MTWGACGHSERLAGRVGWEARVSQGGLPGEGDGVEGTRVLSQEICMPCCFSHAQLCDPMDCSLPAFSIHGILQARIVEWVCHALLQGNSKDE